MEYQPYTVFVTRDGVQSIFASILPPTSQKNNVFREKMLLELANLPARTFTPNDLKSFKDEPGVYVNARLFQTNESHDYVKQKQVLSLINRIETRIHYHKYLVASIETLPILSFFPEKCKKLLGEALP